MIVADTNTITYLYINSEKSAQAGQLLMRKPKWIAPSLWKSEFRIMTLLVNVCHENLI